MKALVLDAYDSFVYIICQYLMKAGIEVEVVRNDQLQRGQIELINPDFIVLGPGPGHPADAQYVELIKRYAGSIPILGVCLGHQAIGLAFGGKIIQADNLMHGKTSEIHHDGAGCFQSLEEPLRATRYHSLIVSRDSLPDCFIITAWSSDDGYIMGLRHKHFPIESVQFHPESVYTEHGLAMFLNFAERYCRSKLNSQTV
ncbi:anthranilate synthase component II [Paenibacillus sp. GCM10027627]|uniref:anthranilate synthase component II n=1 Tax=unclassified Paenibacillus TaxID=185978 RepID=UPI00364295BD